MTRHTNERFAPTVLAVSIAAIGLAGVAPHAFADDDEIAVLTKPESRIELGAGNVSAGSTKFGDYTGLDKSGNHAIANTSLTLRGENAGYLELNATNLGLDSRSLSADGGVQGNFGVRINYDELPHFWAHGYQSPYQGLGSNFATLPAGWVRPAAAPTTTANATLQAEINANMHSFEIKTDRKTLGLGVNKFVSDRWELVANFKRDEKQGNKLIGAVVGYSGGNPRATILPEPVDWTTDQAEIFARYSFEKLQFQVGYYGSIFKNDNQALKWQNAYPGTVWGGAASDYSIAQVGLPPDNQFHQLNASVGYSFSPVSRLNGAFSIGRATQNEQFLPYTVNPAITVNQALPRSSLNGEVITTNASLNFTTKLMPKLGLVAGYRYYDRDNRTPQSQYNYVGGDSVNQSATLNSSRVRTNLPVDSTKHQVNAELDYQLAPETKVKLGYEFDHVRKTFEAIDWEKEQTVKTGIKHRFGEMTSAGVDYEYSDRQTSAYNGSAPFVASYSAQYIAGTVNPNFIWDNVPTQKKFFMAPRKRDKLRAFVNFSPVDRLDLEFSADYKDDRYTHSELGLRQASGWAGNFDASLVVSENLTGNMFVTVENYQTNQRSVNLGATQANYTDVNRYWTADINDRTYTWGLGFRATPFEKLELGGNFVQAYSKGKTAISLASASAGTAAGMPDLNSRMDRFDLFGNYQLQKDLKLRMQYIHQRFRSTDWAFDQVAAAASAANSNGLANVIGTNQVSPDYTVDVVGISAIYSFR